MGVIEISEGEMDHAESLFETFAEFMSEMLDSLDQSEGDVNPSNTGKSDSELHPGNCPVCGSPDTTAAISFEEIRDDVTTGFCFSCGHVWCLECGEPLCLSTVCSYMEICYRCQENNNVLAGCKKPIWKCDLIRRFSEDNFS